MINIETPYLLYLGDAKNLVQAKTAAGIAYFRPDQCTGYCRLPNAEAKIDNLPELSIEKAKEKGAKTFVIGLANQGGFIPENWIEDIISAIKLDFNIASGMHERLEDVKVIAEHAKTYNVKLYNVRHYSDSLPVGNGTPRLGKRILTVGTDCSTGKMYTALKIQEEMQKRKLKSDFVATGQTGILVSGKGISIDAVAADFISGTAEHLSPSNQETDFYIVEGQGSLYHPSYAGVSLGLLHGSQPDYIVMCHDYSRKHIRHLKNYSLPDIKDCIKTNLEMGKLTNPNIKCIGISVNTSSIGDEESKIYLSKLEKEIGLPATDPCKFGVTKLVDSICPN